MNETESGKPEMLTTTKTLRPTPKTDPSSLVRRTRPLEMHGALLARLFLGSIGDRSDADRNLDPLPIDFEAVAAKDATAGARPRRKDPDGRTPSFRVVRSVVDTHFLPSYGDRSARVLEDADEMEAFIRARRVDGYAENSLCVFKWVLAEIAKYGMRIGAVSKNGIAEIPANVQPARRAKSPLKQQASILSVEQIKQIIDCEVVPVFVRWAIAGMFFLLVRPSELRGFICGDLNYSSQPLPSIHLRQQATNGVVIDLVTGAPATKKGLKDSHPRLLPVHPALGGADLSGLLGKARVEFVRITGRKPRDEDALFWYTHAGDVRHWADDTLRHAFRRALKTAGIPEIQDGDRGPHVLRHSGISAYENAIAAAGLDLNFAIEYIAHPVTARQRRGTHGIYSHPDLAHLSRAILTLKV